MAPIADPYLEPVFSDEFLGLGFSGQFWSRGPAQRWIQNFLKSDLPSMEHQPHILWKTPTSSPQKKHDV